MDLDQTIADLRAERDAIDEAIAALERLAATKGSKRRGRPPKWLEAARKRKEQENKTK